MKDLYTFDRTKDEAIRTYEEVRLVYSAFFDEFKLPYLVADADSGSIGGDVNHEYHIASPKGEDNVLVCDLCRYTVNEEAMDATSVSGEGTPCNCPKCSGEMHNIKAIELGHTFFLGTKYSKALEATVELKTHSPAEKAIDEASSDDGTNAGGRTPQKQTTVDIEMGCHGIGVSRLIAGIANLLADDKGLNWPRAIAPFEVIVIPTKGQEGEGANVLDWLTKQGPHPSDSKTKAPFDAVLDDRDKPTAWKLNDADLIGYPVIVILGTRWKGQKLCEVQCRRLDFIRQDVSAYDLPTLVESLLSKL